MSLWDDAVDLRRQLESLAGLGRATSWAEVGERLRSFATDHGVARAIHFSLTPDPQGWGGLLRVTTLSENDGALRTSDEDVAFDDPLVGLCEGRRPISWSGEGVVDAALAELLDRLGGDGTPHPGVAVPIHGPGSARGLFAVTSAQSPAEWHAHSRRLTPWLEMFGWEFHRSVTTLFAACEDGAVPVPPREVAVLRSAADGRTAHDTARLLGLSVETVESYVRDAVRRLGCINKTHAVAVAVRRGLI